MPATLPTSISPSNWTNTTNFNCVGIHRLPLQGSEFLILAILVFGVLSMYWVTFIDVALKQAWPNRFLSSEALAKVVKLQTDFPLLPKLGDESEAEAIDILENDSALGTLCGSSDENSSTIIYDQVVSQAPYISTSSVDEDLVIILANNQVFPTVSSYSSSTVRGYSTLSTICVLTGVYFGFLWVHNAMVYPIGDNKARYVNLLGYLFILLTGIVMMMPNTNAVHRARNILMWDSVSVDSAVLNLHNYSILNWGLLPALSCVHQLASVPNLPNGTGLIIGVTLQLTAAISFYIPQILNKQGKITLLTCNKMMIFAEVYEFVGAYVAFMLNETYASAACAQNVDSYNKLILTFLFVPWAVLFAKQYSCNPTHPGVASDSPSPADFPNGPSVMLCRAGVPCAVSGPAPVLNYNQEVVVLPIVQPK